MARRTKTQSTPVAGRRRVAQPRAASFPIVGIGASAGGLEAFKQLLALLPADTGMAFTLLQHLDPTHSSGLTAVLKTSTEMPVVEATNGRSLQPNHVYVMPADADMTLKNGKLQLVSRGRDSRGLHLPIDAFFRSMASELRAQAIGVVLSGTASDGTEGLRAIKSEGGITLVQSPQTAKFPGMPDSAVRAGVVDHALGLPELAAELARLSNHPYLSIPESKAPVHGDHSEDDALAEAFTVLRERTGVDFSEYKPPTIRRRLSRRMTLLRIENLNDYVRTLHEVPDEPQRLVEDVLVHVTSFFRDPDVFEALKRDVFPAILERKSSAPIRIWVPGCSSGEEVYSIAIALFEHLGPAISKHRIQIFGSDLSERCIDHARKGLYQESAVRDVSPARLNRFFSRVDNRYCIDKAIRDCCVFVKHDLGHDPPFSRLDLVSCRNALIYFAQPLQQRILGTFHYCLNPSGFLVLGRSESITGYAQYFSARDKPHRIFSRTAGASTLRFAPLAASRPASQPTTERAAASAAPPAVDVAKHVDHLLLAQYAPPGVVVNERLEILQFRGRTGPYLEPAPGQPHNHLPAMLRDGLLADLRLAFRQAKRQMKMVRRAGLVVRDNATVRHCALSIIPIAGLPNVTERLFAILFEDDPASGKESKRGKQTPKERSLIAKVEQELAATKEYQQTLVEEHERMNDDLTSANEELVSSNEELQSLNEEMETAKEELQSSNEELTTVNDELQHRNQELNVVNNDLINLLASVDVPVIIVDASRRIRQFTPKARGLMNVLATDVGRPIDDIRPNIGDTDLGALVATTMATAVVTEREVRDHDGHWHRLRIRPYTTPDKRVDGAIISLTDIDALKCIAADAQISSDYFAAIVEAVQIPLVALNPNMQTMSGNQAFREGFDLGGGELNGQNFFEVCGGAFDTPQLRQALTNTVQHGRSFQGIEIECEIPGRGTQALAFSARPASSPTGAAMMVVAIENVTEPRRSQRERALLLQQTAQAKIAAEGANAAKDLFLAVLSHELRTPLTTILLYAQRLTRGELSSAQLGQASEAIERAVSAQAQLIDDLLDVSRISAGKMIMEIQNVDMSLVVSAAMETVSPAASRKSVELTAILPAGEHIWVSGDPLRLRQVVWNLLSNAIQHSNKNGRVTITLDVVDRDARVRVTDTGRGIGPALLPHVFESFVQAEQVSTRATGGLGLGLTIVKTVVEAHNGKVQAESAGLGLGATFSVRVPLLSGSAIAAAPSAAHTESRLHDLADLRGLRILIVDDDQDILDAVAAMLAEMGAEIWKASSASNARAVLRTFLPDLLVSDIAMPDEDGLSLIRAIRAQGNRMPAVALTGLASPADCDIALRAGFDAHLAKPVNSQRLASTLVQASGRRSARPVARS